MKRKLILLLVALVAFTLPILTAIVGFHFGSGLQAQARASDFYVIAQDLRDHDIESAQAVSDGVMKLLLVDLDDIGQSPIYGWTSVGQQALRTRETILKYFSRNPPSAIPQDSPFSSLQHKPENLSELNSFYGTLVERDRRAMQMISDYTKRQL